MDKKIFECNCQSLEHLFRMSYWPEEKDDPAFVVLEITPRSFTSFWERVWRALKYIFKVEPWISAEVLVDEDRAKEMIKFLDRWPDRKGSQYEI